MVELLGLPLFANEADLCEDRLAFGGCVELGKAVRFVEPGNNAVVLFLNAMRAGVGRPQEGWLTLL